MLLNTRLGAWASVPAAITVENSGAWSRHNCNAARASLVASVGWLVT